MSEPVRTNVQSRAIGWRSRFAQSTTVLPERCADSPLDCVSRARCVADPNSLFGNSVGQWQDGRRPSRLRSARVSLDFVGTPFAHLQTHDIAKFAIRRPGLADAGSTHSISHLASFFWSARCEALVSNPVIGTRICLNTTALSLPIGSGVHASGRPSIEELWNPAVNVGGLTNGHKGVRPCIRFDGKLGLDVENLG